MSTLIANATIKGRRDTAGNWTSNNPTPGAGEWCYETDTGKAKIGDGSTAWTSLKYACIPSGLVTAERYNTGWVANSDWTAVSLNVNHALGANLPGLDVAFFISPTGSDSDCVKMGGATVSSVDTGFSFKAVDVNNIELDLHTSGIAFITSAFGIQIVDTESWYYKVVVTKLTIQT